MAKIEIVKASTSYTVNVFVQDSSKTDGSGLAGLVFNTAGLTAYYMRPRAASVAITLATLAAVTSAWSSGGFKEIDATNAPGTYRLDIPDAALATGADWVNVYLRGAANMAPVVLEIQLTGMDLNDATAGGMSRVDAAVSSRASAAALATVQADTDDLQTRVPAALVGGRMDASVGAVAAGAIGSAAFAAGAIDANAIATDAIGSAELAASAVTEIQTGLATAAAQATLQVDTDDIQTRLPAALVGGRMDSSVGAVAANAITAAAIAADAIGASELAADAVTEIQAGLALAGNVTVGGYAAGQDPAALLLDVAGGIEPSVTLRQALRVIFDAAGGGTTDGAGTTTFHVKSRDGAKIRITATVDGAGNRTALTLGDLS